MTAAYEPDTPVTAEAKLGTLSGEVEKASAVLGQARDAEMEAQEAYDDAYLDAVRSPQCPVPGLYDDGRRITVGERKDWITSETADEKRLLERAKNTRRKAADRLKVVCEQASHQQSRVKSVTEAYRFSGREPW